MKFIYICSKFRGNREENIEKAKERSQWVYKKGHIPVCVHIYLEEATGLNEDNGERETLLNLGREFVGICDELWVFGDISEGMEGEIRYAEQSRIKIKYIKEI